MKTTLKSMALIFLASVAILTSAGCTGRGVYLNAALTEYLRQSSKAEELAKHNIGNLIVKCWNGNPNQSTAVVHYSSDAGLNTLMLDKPCQSQDSELVISRDARGYAVRSTDYFNERVLDTYVEAAIASMKPKDTL